MNHNPLCNKGVVVHAEGFVIQEEPIWFVHRVYQAFGREQESGRPSADPPSELTDTYREFIYDDWEEYLDRIESGSLEPAGSEVVELDGHSFRMQVWDLDHPELGVIKYYAGDVVVEEDSGQEE